MPRVMPVHPEWLRPDLYRGEHLGVDKEKKVIHGYIMAQRGPFKTPGRGEFNDASLAKTREAARQATREHARKVRAAEREEHDVRLAKIAARAQVEAAERAAERLVQAERVRDRENRMRARGDGGAEIERRADEVFLASCALRAAPHTTEQKQASLAHFREALDPSKDTKP